MEITSCIWPPKRDGYGPHLMTLQPAPEELNIRRRVPTGETVPDPDSVYDDDSGRSFHGYKFGKYYLPNDGIEQARLDFQYAGFNILLWNRLCFAPLTTIPKNVLDIATGTGIWALEFARQNPHSHVIGTDLSLIQPPNIPPNCEFIREDSEEEWLFHQKFDYVHLRLVFTCFDYPRRVIAEAFKNMNPGGWIEFQDGSANIQSKGGPFEGSALQRWSECLISGAGTMGRDIEKAQDYKKWLIEAGFVNVVEDILMFPCNEWPEDPKLKRAGGYMRMNIYNHTQGLSWRMLHALGMTDQEIIDFLPQVRKDVRNQKIKSYINFYVVYGQKPRLSLEEELGKW